MECIRCGGFSSTRVCWSCSQRPDAISHALLENYQTLLETCQKDAERYRWLRKQVKVWPADSWSEHKVVCLDVKFPCDPPSISPMTDAEQFDAAIDALVIETGKVR